MLFELLDLLLPGIVELRVSRYPERVYCLTSLGHVFGMRVLISNMCVVATWPTSPQEAYTHGVRSPVLLAHIATSYFWTFSGDHASLSARAKIRSAHHLLIVILVLSCLDRVCMETRVTIRRKTSTYQEFVRAATTGISTTPLQHSDMIVLQE